MRLPAQAAGLLLLLLLLALPLSLCAAAEPAANSINQAAEKAFADMPGNHAFLFSQIVDGVPKPIAEIHENDRYAIGSSFKLFILGALADDVNADRRRLDNTVLLEKQYKGPPSSEMASWPIGSPVTLHTLALKMIWISDNTATDHLLHALGRERIEKIMAAMGHAHPEWNTPLLSTREMTMLRDKASDMPGNKYAKLDEAEKRKFLAKLSDRAPDYEKLEFDTAAYNVSEWYATPLDMAKAMAWLKTHTDPKMPATSVRGILAVETKLPHDAKTWPYVGFKGGSEDQLLAGNWLLQYKDGRWFTYHVFYNRPEGKADPEKFLKAVEAIFAAIDASLNSPAARK